jgi:S1-C subfamily serine protease
MLQMRAEGHKPVPVTILRDGKEMELKLTLNP